MFLCKTRQGDQSDWNVCTLSDLWFTLYHVDTVWSVSGSDYAPRSQSRLNVIQHLRAAYLLPNGSILYIHAGSCCVDLWLEKKRNKQWPHALGSVLVSQAARLCWTCQHWGVERKPSPRPPPGCNIANCTGSGMCSLSQGIGKYSLMEHPVL